MCEEGIDIALQVDCNEYYANSRLGDTRKYTLTLTRQAFCKFGFGGRWRPSVLARHVKLYSAAFMWLIFSKRVDAN
jgi:hypothetical protein